MNAVWCSVGVESSSLYFIDGSPSLTSLPALPIFRWALHSDHRSECSERTTRATITFCKVTSSVLERWTPFKHTCDS